MGGKERECLNVDKVCLFAAEGPGGGGGWVPVSGCGNYRRRELQGKKKTEQGTRTPKKIKTSILHLPAEKKTNTAKYQEEGGGKTRKRFALRRNRREGWKRTGETGRERTGQMVAFESGTNDPNRKF